MKIRPASVTDDEAIAALYLDAFDKEEGSEIARLVAAMSADETARPLLSLVAEQPEGLAGHVLFSKVQVTDSGSDHAMQGPEARILAPLGVAQRCQGCGIGSALVKAGLQRLRDAGFAQPTC